MEQLSQKSAEKLAELCTSIINNPEANIMKVSDVLDFSENAGIIHLSLAKVFKSIVPLYKIRLHSDKIKHKNQDLDVSEYDKQLFKHYNLYIKELCACDLPESYKAAAELLKTLDHFNFADRVISKVLIGTTKDHAVSTICVEALVNRIENDLSGDTVFIIMDKCLDYDFSHVLVEALLRSKYLEKCVQVRTDKETFYEKKKIEERKQAKKEKVGKGFFAKKYNNDKKEKKEEKKRLKLQKEVKERESQELNPINEKNYIRTINALQRLYFTILKDNIFPCLMSVYTGIRKYIRIIRKEFHEGLYTLLNDTIRQSDPCSALEGILSVFDIYMHSGMDFKRIIDVFFDIVHPFNYTIQSADFKMICRVGRNLFIDIQQPKPRIIALIQRLMHSKCVRHISEYAQFIKDLEVKYDIDFSDHEIKNKYMYEDESLDIDSIPSKPFYEYYLYKKMR